MDTGIDFRYNSMRMPEIFSRGKKTSTDITVASEIEESLEDATV
jgi:hypothetical protein